MRDISILKRISHMATTDGSSNSSIVFIDVGTQFTFSRHLRNQKHPPYHTNYARQKSFVIIPNHFLFAKLANIFCN